MKKYFLAGLFSVVSIVNTAAQTNTMDSNSVKLMNELTNIQLASDAYNGQKFDLSLINSNGLVTDTTTGTFTISGENYRSVFDSVESIQNNFVNLEIHYDGKVMVASKPTPFTKQFFKGNVDAGLFQGINLQSFSTVMIGSEKQLIFNFLPESEYAEYKINYNPATYRVSEVFVKMKVPDGAGGFVSGQYLTSRVVLSNFVAPSSGVSFDTGTFFFIDANGVFQVTPSYSDYEIINVFTQN